MRAYRAASYSVCLFLLAEAFSGCAALKKYGKLEKSARQYYRIGDYDRAVLKSAESLRLNPEYDKAQNLIQDAFRAAVNAHESKIKERKLSSAKFRWDDIVSEYEALVEVNRTVMELPTLRRKKTKELITFKVTDYTDSLAVARTHAAEAHYQEGMRLSQNSAIDFQKHAAKEFKAALRFVPGYKDAADWYEKCRRAAIKRMAIIPFDDKSGKNGRYGALSEMITDEVISDIMSDPDAMEFLELVSRDRLESVMQEQQLGLTDLVNEATAAKLGKILGVHEIVTGQITQIIYAPPRTTRRTERQKSRVVVSTEKYRDSKGKMRTRDVYGDVYATVTFYKTATSASIVGSYKIIDVETAKIKKSESFSGKSAFVAQWAKFSGDKRALDYSAEKLVRKAQELPPVEEEMVNRAAQDLSHSLAESLKEYAR